MKFEVLRRVGFLLLLIGFGGARAADRPGVFRQVFGEQNGSLTTLTNSAVFPNSPILESIESTFEAPHDWSDSYGTRMRALVTAPMDGNYTFWISTDDQGALFLSSDETPSNRKLIAYVNGWSAFRTWTVETNQASAPIALIGGKR